MSSRQVDANGFQGSQSYKNNQNLRKYRPLAPKLPYTQMVDSSSRQFLNFQLTSKSGTQVLKPSTPMVAADINTRVIERSNIIVDTTTRERPNDYDSLHETNVLQPKENTGFLLHDVNSELDPRYQEDFDQENLMDLEKVKKLRQEKKKRKISDDQPQTIDRWSDDETYKLLIYLEDNFNKYQKGKNLNFMLWFPEILLNQKLQKVLKGD